MVVDQNCPNCGCPLSYSIKAKNVTPVGSEFMLYEPGDERFWCTECGWSRSGAVGTVSETLGKPQSLFQARLRAVVAWCLRRRPGRS